MPGSRKQNADNLRMMQLMSTPRAWLIVLPLLAVFSTAWAQPVPPDAQVAISPFENISGAADDAWIGAGIAETLAAELSGAGFRIQFGQVSGPDVWQITGGYQRLGDRLRLTARVIDPGSGAVGASARVDGTMDELFSLQDELAARLREAMTRAEAAPRPTPAPAPAAQPDPAPSGIIIPSPSPSTPAAPEPETTGSGLSGFAATPTGLIDGPAAPVAPATINRDEAGRATVRAVRIDRPIQLDGVLDEAVYETTAPLTDFIQQLPDAGDPATEQTEAWVFYDAEAIYITGRLWDSAPESEWVANEMQRDSFQLINNETFSVALDTFYDRRNGYAFQVNPIGGFVDFQLTDEGNPNIDWNPIWDVRTGRFDGGWTVEMEIPFKSIRYRPGAAQVWGLQIGRRVYHKNESTYLTPVPISAGPGLFRLSVAGTLTGLDVPGDNRTFEIKPYAIGSSATDLTSSPQIRNDGDGDFGVDVKYGVTQNLTADFTYNTDFAQVEVDEQQVNLTRFSLFFPEKREFFLESRGIFDFGRGVGFGSLGGPGGGGRPGSGGFFGGGDTPTVFFSRRIGLESGETVPILGGGRLTGKTGPFSVGALNIQTDDVRSSSIAGTNFTVMRVKRDILRRSSIGGIFTNRSVALQGDGANQAFGVDGVFSFYDNLNFNAYWARTETPDLDGENESYQAAMTYNGDLYALGIDHLLVGDNFNPEVGFLRRNDFRKTVVQAQYSPRPEMELIRQVTLKGKVDYIETVAGALETRNLNASFQTEFENSDRFIADVQQSFEFLFQPFDITRNISLPVGGYEFQDYYVAYNMGAQRRVSGRLSLQVGQFFGGDITAVGFTGGRVEITPQFSFEPSISVNDIKLPEGNFTTTLVTSRVTYTFTPRMFFGGLLQYNSSRNSLSTNLRLRWEYQPGSEIFVVYNDQRDTALSPGRDFPMLENRAFIVKFTRLFRF